MWYYLYVIIMENKNSNINMFKESVSIYKDDNKCINCNLCKLYCNKIVGISSFNDCINCGQCIFSCPVRALSPKNEYNEVEKIIKTKEKIVIGIVSPAVKVQLGEFFNIDESKKIDGKIVSSLKKLGFNYVFDTSLGADLTTILEAKELIDRIKSNTNLPLFTSCCPSWVKYANTYHKELLDNISICKSPISMFSTIIKEYFSKIINVDKDKLLVVAITPCTSKKYEKTLYPETDYVITSSELSDWINKNNIDFINIEDSSYDDVFKDASGSGIIFGSSGGVTESIMRTVYYLLTNKDSKKLLKYKIIRGNEKIKKSKLIINGLTINIAVIHTIPALEEFLKTDDYKKYHFIEVMNCNGGCIGGAGRIYNKKLENEYLIKRSKALYNYDKTNKLRYSYKNKDVINIFSNFLNNESNLNKLYTNKIKSKI